MAELKTFTIRLPVALERQIEGLADKNRRSRNAEIQILLEKALRDLAEEQLMQFRRILDRQPS